MPTLLVVDDDSNQQQSIDDAAIRAGFKADEIVYAFSRDEFESANVTPDVAVIDLNLGVEEVWNAGLNLIWSIRQNYPDCRIIALTTKMDDTVGASAIANGADSFINGQWALINWKELLAHQLRIDRSLVTESTA